MKLSIAFHVKLCFSILIRDNWVFTWIQVITWITHTELGWIRTTQGSNWIIFRTIKDQTQPFLEQYNPKLNHFCNNIRPNSTISKTIQGQIQPVTNYYLVGKLSTSLNLSSYLVSSWSKSLSISGGDSSCSWVLVHALDLIVKEEFKSVMLGWAGDVGSSLWAPVPSQ